VARSLRYRLDGAQHVKLAPEQLAADLAARLRPVYLLSGDEPLLLDEALDAIRAAARARGFEERAVFFIERGSSVWQDIEQCAQALSLFASRRIVEVRLRTGKPGTSGAAVLMQLLESAGEDLLALIITGALDRETLGALWVQLAERRGAVVQIWPVTRARMPEWLRVRFAASGLRPSDAAVELLAARSEGNLLAARQEIDKLALLLPSGAAVGLEEVIAGSADSARFDVFQLGTGLREGDAARSLRILASLRAEGAEPVLVLWSVLRELRARPLARATRLRLLRRAMQADRAAKGQLSADPWDELAALVADLAGGPALPLVPMASP
jgi:DNA polymerase-3 subunit delta